MNLIPYLMIWVVLAVVVIVLAIYRKMLTSNEDDTLHVLDGDAAVVSQQTVLAKKVEMVDRWGKILTIVALIYGIVIAAGYLYFTWIASSEIRMG
jgi:hypothetical protein